ncbi:hypothetical protein CMV_021434 [Castanea mollissima]|uniref:Uncharacterized protein n=1 Tax=Castanea mollissima TaxID=60419 RepID=A0A8J4V975_9ROSI|nr:hypothetical protein CMV_021434 [Castanea mollissima]
MVIVQRLFHSICDREPEFQSDEDAINQLQVLLTQMGSSPILLILDDVCSGSEFHLEKFKFDIPKYNILVTSRTTLPKFSFTYNLKPLNDEDATTLLRHSASLQDGSSHIPDEVIKKIVRGCGGLPLALEVNGKSLYGKPVEAWRSRARKWSNGSFAESQGIDVPSLFDIWEVLHELDEDGNDAIAYLHELATRNLATLVMTSLPDFMFKMDKLKVLMINNYGYFPAKLRNFQLLKSLPNLKTIKLEKVSIPSLCKAPVLLKSLKKISLCIRHLPKDIGELCNLKELHMKGCLSLRKGLLPSTTNLEQLKLVICDEERAKFREPIKEVLTNLEVKVAEKDINLTWLLKP